MSPICLSDHEGGASADPLHRCLPSAVGWSLSCWLLRYSMAVSVLHGPRPFGLVGRGTGVRRSGRITTVTANIELATNSRSRRRGTLTGSPPPPPPLRGRMEPVLLATPVTGSKSKRKGSCPDNQFSFSAAICPAWSPPLRWVGRGTGVRRSGRMMRQIGVKKLSFPMCVHDHGGGAPSRVPLHRRLPSAAGWSLSC